MLGTAGVIFATRMGHAHQKHHIRLLKWQIAALRALRARKRSHVRLLI